MKVRATMAGTYGRRHVMPGDIFDVDPKMFADAATSRYGWMLKVEEEVPAFRPVGPVQTVETQQQKDEREWLENEEASKS